MVRVWQPIRGAVAQRKISRRGNLLLLDRGQVTGPLPASSPTRMRFFVHRTVAACIKNFFLFVSLFLTLLLSSFWTSRGHRCRPFFPPVLAFSFYRA